MGEGVVLVEDDCDRHTSANVSSADVSKTKIDVMMPSNLLMMIIAMVVVYQPTPTFLGLEWVS